MLATHDVMQSAALNEGGQLPCVVPAAGEEIDGGIASMKRTANSDEPFTLSKARKGIVYRMMLN